MMSRPRPSDDRLAARTAEFAERNQRAREQTMARDGARDPAENLAEGVALARAARKWAGIARRDRTDP